MMTPKKMLIESLRAEINSSGGAIRFDRFMERALYDPAQGYYTAAESIPTGRGGDFYTSVSVGPLFGELIGRRLAQLWESLGSPTRFTIAEQGAMDGQFAADLLNWAQSQRADFFSVIDYLLIEPFPRNRERQRERLANHPARWVEDWSEVPEESLVGAIFSNELIDSFPVRLVARRQNQWRELWVEWRGERFAFTERPADDSLGAEIERLQIPPIEGYTTEINANAAAWMRSVATRLSQGVILTVDYGFPRETLYAPERGQGTLQCYNAHQRSDNPLDAVGEQDITTHIDFTTLIETGEALGLKTERLIDQHHFIIEQLADAERAGRVYSPKEIRMLKTLLHPELMGTRFQFLEQSRR